MKGVQDMKDLTPNFERFDFMNFPLMSVGFDHIFKNRDHFRVSSNLDTYPPYNLIKLDDYKYMIEMAVAGFEKEDIKIMYEPGSLTIESNGEDTELDEPDLVYLHKGIAMRKFIKKFTLSDAVIVVDSELQEGMLTIHLEKHIPDELKPKLIEIN